jgi:ferredoxin
MLRGDVGASAADAAAATRSMRRRARSHRPFKFRMRPNLKLRGVPPSKRPRLHDEGSTQGAQQLVSSTNPIPVCESGRSEQRLQLDSALVHCVEGGAHVAHRSVARGGGGQVRWMLAGRRWRARPQAQARWRLLIQRRPTARRRCTQRRIAGTPSASRCAACGACGSLSCPMGKEGARVRCFKRHDAALWHTTPPRCSLCSSLAFRCASTESPTTTSTGLLWQGARRGSHRLPGTLRRRRCWRRYER